MSDSGLEKAVSVFDKELDVFLAKKENFEKDVDVIRGIEKKIETVLAKSKEVDSEGDDLRARDILLKYYSSECTIHGAYILTVAIGVFAFLQVTKPMNEFVAIIPFVLSGFVTISVYILAKTIFWGTIASAVTHVREITVEEAEKGINKDRDKITFLLRLHRACINHFTNYNKTLNYFVGIHRPNKTLLLYVILFFLFGLIFWCIQIILL
jgi:hypothetical protein